MNTNACEQIIGNWRSILGARPTKRVNVGRHFAYRITAGCRVTADRPLQLGEAVRLTTPPMTPDIPGADTVVRWFGKWPSFHDAEVLSVHIDRERRSSSLHVRAWNRSDRTDAAGQFILERVATVIFEFAG